MSFNNGSVEKDFPYICGGFVGQHTPYGTTLLQIIHLRPGAGAGAGAGVS